MDCILCIAAYLGLFALVMWFIIRRVRRYEREDQEAVDLGVDEYERFDALRNAHWDSDFNPLFVSPPPQVTVYNRDKDRSLNGKARVKARKAARRG